jgi:hypothetical protein
MLIFKKRKTAKSDTAISDLQIIIKINLLLIEGTTST